MMDETAVTPTGESLGRIEVAPEVLTLIARAAVEDVEGVSRLVASPPDGRLFRRAPRHDGIVMTFEEGRLAFDIYLLMEPQVNLRATSRAVQTAVVEAIDKMIGLPVTAVNVHVEDVDVGPEAGR